MKAEEALRQAQKMEAIGQLTGGVAHDFNNLLTVILGGLETITRQLGAAAGAGGANGSSARRGMATHGAERAATLTARLLAFARRQPLDPKPVDAARLVTGLADLLQRTLGETSRWRRFPAPGSGARRPTRASSRTRWSTWRSTRATPCRTAGG